MLVVNTKALVRLLVHDDAKQAKAADPFIVKCAWVSHLVLAETLWVPQAMYSRTAARIAAALNLLLEHENLVLLDAETTKAGRGNFSLSPRWGFQIA